VPVDEFAHDLQRRSSSAWAKNALASFRISMAGLAQLALQRLDALLLGRVRLVTQPLVSLGLAHPQRRERVTIQPR